ncbi:MAG: LysR family transcriptional regulator [Pseudomonadota bacterium]
MLVTFYFLKVKDLNYHHLRYFLEVAEEGHLGRAAERLNVSQSALSIQLRALEDRIGHKLFDRVGRRLELTEVGRLTQGYARRIFGVGKELQATLARLSSIDAPLRVGAVSTLSRNFQMAFLQPLLTDSVTALQLRSGNITTLLAALENHELDVVLTTEQPPHGFEAYPIASQEVGLHGHPDRTAHETLGALLRSEPLIVPTDKAIRPQFDGLLAQLDVTPNIAAEVDDMAMVRLLTRENVGVAVAPAVVLADEIASGRLATAPFDLGISEPFLAITARRVFPHPELVRLIAASRD